MATVAPAHGADKDIPDKEDLGGHPHKKYDKRLYYVFGFDDISCKQAEPNILKILNSK